MVTRRLRPLQVDGRTVHQIGLPFHWGFAGETVGGIANDLTSLVADPNVSMHEGKVVRLPGRGRPAATDQHPTPTKPSGALADARARPRHAARPPSRREIRRWRLAKRSLAALPPGGDADAGPPGRTLLDRLIGRSTGGAARRRSRRWASSPTRPSASAARRARSRASSGTSSRPTASPGPATATTTPAQLSATSWRHVKFIEQFRPTACPGRPGRAPTCSIPAAG